MITDPRSPSLLKKSLAHYIYALSVKKGCNGFGGKEEKLVNLDVVSVSIKNIHGVYCGRIELYVVPFICKPLCDQQIDLAQATYEHLTVRCTGLAIVTL